MDFSKILTKHYKENAWGCGETYESMMWQDTTLPKPSKEHLESLWVELQKAEMRVERNKLLKDSDYRVLPDYPAVKKDEWIIYRESLRDFPATWVEGTPFPNPPV
jgi:DNA-dependent RNA polymerase auxiliary subunit epsilon